MSLRKYVHVTKLRLHVRAMRAGQRKKSFASQVTMSMNSLEITNILHSCFSHNFRNITKLECVLEPKGSQLWSCFHSGVSDKPPARFSSCSLAPCGCLAVVPFHQFERGPKKKKNPVVAGSCFREEKKNSDRTLFSFFWWLVNGMRLLRRSVGSKLKILKTWRPFGLSFNIARKL